MTTNINNYKKLDNQQQKLAKAVISGWKTRKQIKMAKKQFQNILKEIEGSDVDIYWHDTFSFQIKKNKQQSIDDFQEKEELKSSVDSNKSKNALKVKSNDLCFNISIMDVQIKFDITQNLNNLNHFNLFMNSSFAQALAFSFNLKEIVQSAQRIDLGAVEQVKRQSQGISFQQAFTQNGLLISQLFGYHFKKKIKSQTIKGICQIKKLLSLKLQQFQQIILNNWLDIKEYATYVKTLFQILKAQDNAVFPETMDEYLNICEQNMKDFTFNIKSVVSPQKLSKIKKKIVDLVQKQDLRQTGLIEPQKINQIFQQEAGIQLNFLKQTNLIQQNLVNYQKFLSFEYLDSGKELKQFLLGKCSQKIAKTNNKQDFQNKNKMSKTANKSQTIKVTKNDKKQQKQSKKDALISQMFQNYKKDTSQESKTKFLMMKQIILQIILDSVQVQLKQVQNEQKSNSLTKQYAFKSTYTTDPIVSQNIFKKMYEEGSKILHYKNNIGIFIYKNYAYLFDINKNASSLQNQSIKKISLNLSSLTKESPIVDYQIFDDSLYILREDGLLYNWSLTNFQKNSFDKMIQTSYKKNKNKNLTNVINLIKKLDQNSERICQNVLKIDYLNGIIIINCTQSTVSVLQFYNLNLRYLGQIILKRDNFCFSQNYLIQAKFIVKNVMPKLNSDLMISQFDGYKKMLQTCGWHGQKSLPLGRLISESIFPCDLIKIQTFCKWILSYMSQNPIPLSKLNLKQIQSLQKKNSKSLNSISKDLLQNLNLYNYISNENLEEILRFRGDHCLKSVQNRKQNILTLFQDYKLQLPIKQFLTRQELKNWLTPCNLLNEEYTKIISDLDCNPIGQFDLRKVIYNEHIQRIIDSRQQKYTPQNYKILQLPLFIIKDFVSLLQKNIVLFTGLIDSQSIIYLWKAGITKKIPLNYMSQTQDQKNNQISFKYVHEHNCLAVFYNNSILIFQYQQLLKENVIPTRKITGLQLEIADRLISFSYIYHQQTLVLLTFKNIQIYDLQQLLSNSQQILKFHIKPGYKGISVSSNSNYRKEIKKKIISVGRNVHLFFNGTKYNQSLIGVISKDNSDLYLKIFYLSKYSLKVPSKNQSVSLPQKLLKQLQTQSRRNWHLDQVLYSQSSSQQKQWFSHMQNNCINTLKFNKASQKQSDEQAKVAKMTLIKQFHNYYNIIGDVKKMCNKNFISKCLSQSNEKAIKYQLLFQLLTLKSKTKESISQFFSKQFLQFYRNQNTLQINFQKMIDDISTAQQKKFIKRIFYIASLVYRFCFSQFNRNSSPQKQIYKNISSDSKTIDLNLISQLISDEITFKQYNQKKIDQSINLRTSLRSSQPSQIQQKIIKIQIPEIQVVKNSISVFSNLIKDALNMFVNIALNFLPTQYRYLCPRYYTQFVKNQSSQEWQQFNNNNFSQPMNRQTFLSCLKNTSQNFNKGIPQFLQDRQKLKFVKDIICYRYPQATNDYRFLIDILQSYQIINIFQAMYLLTQYSNQVIDLRQSKIKQYYPVQYNLNTVIKLIYDQIQSGKVNLPRSKLSINDLNQLFKGVKLKNQQIQQFFYKQLKANVKTKMAYTSQLNSLIQIYKKGVSLDFNDKNWIDLVSPKFFQISSYINELCQQLQGVRILTGQQLSNTIQSYSQTNMNDLALRCVYASMNIQNPLKQFQKLQQIHAKINLRSSYVNVDSFLKFIKKQKDNKLSFAFSIFSKAQNHEATVSQIEQNLRIPPYLLIRQLYKCGNLLDEQELTNLISLSINHISYKEYHKLINSFTYVKITSSKNMLTSKKISVDYDKGANQNQNQGTSRFIDPLQIKFIKALLTKSSQVEIAWILTQKHEISDLTKLLNKLTVVDGYVSTKQIDVLVGSSIISKTLFPLKKYEEFVQFQTVQKTIKKLEDNLNQFILESLLFSFDSKFELLINLLQQINRKQIPQQSKNEKSAKPIKFSQIVKYLDLSSQFNKQTSSSSINILLLSVIKHISNINKKRKLEDLIVNQPHSKNLSNSILINKTSKPISAVSQIQKELPQILLGQFIETLVFIKRNLQNQVNKYQSNIVQKLKIDKFQFKYTPTLIQYLISSTQNHQFKVTQFSDKLQDKDKYLITLDHIKLMLNQQCKWYINLKPMSKIGQFINHVDKIINKSINSSLFRKFQMLNQKEQQKLSKFYGFISSNKNKLSIQSFYNAISSQVLFSQSQPISVRNNNFSEFYSKLRTMKSFAKTLPFQIMQIFDLIKQNQSEIINKVTLKQTKQLKIHNISYRIFFQYAQNFISNDQRVRWLYNFIEAKIIYQNNLTPPQDQKQLLIGCFDQLSNLWQQKLPLLNYGLSKDTQMVYEIGNKLAQGFNYEQYLFLSYFDLRDDKSKSLLVQLLKIEEVQQSKMKLTQFFPQIGENHFNLLYKHIKANKAMLKQKLHDNKVDKIIDLKPQYQTLLLNQIRKFFIQFDKVQNPNLKIPVNFVNQYEHLHKTLFQNLQHDSVLNYYVSYFTIKQETQKLLVFILKSNKYKKSVIKQIRRILNTHHITPFTLFDILGVQKQSSQTPQKIHMYFSYLLNYHNIRNDCQSFIKQTQQFKLSDEFWQFLINHMIKTFLKYDNNSMSINSLTPETFINLLNLNFNVVKNDTEEKKQQMNQNQSFQQIYKTMDIMGIGFVNINQVDFFLQKLQINNELTNQTPYFKIKTFIKNTRPELIELKPIAANPEVTNKKDEIIQNLLKKETTQKLYSAFDPKQPSKSGFFNNKIKIISKSDASGILAQYTSEQHLQYIKQKFQIDNFQLYKHLNVDSSTIKSKYLPIKQAKSEYLNLEKLIQWVENRKQDHNKNKETVQKDKMVQRLLKLTQSIGGVQQFIKKAQYLFEEQKLPSQLAVSQYQEIISSSIKIISKLLQIEQKNNNLIQDDKISNKFVLKLKNHQKVKSFEKILKNQILINSQTKINILEAIKFIVISVLNQYNNRVRGYDTNNNTVFMHLKKLSITQFKLLQKFFYSTFDVKVLQTISIFKQKRVNKHSLFHLICSNAVDSTYKEQKVFSLLQLWNFISKLVKNKVYSKKDVEIVFQIIDLNGDGQINYFQFVKFWSAVQQLFPFQKPSQFSLYSEQLPKTIPIYQLKFSIMKNVIQFLKKKILSNQEITIQTLMNAINSQNKQKVYKLIQIIYDEPLNSGKNSQQNANILDKDKLKMIYQKIYLRTFQINQANLSEVNYLLQWVAKDLLQFVNRKNKSQINKNIDVNSLVKYIKIKYPNLGGQILSYLHKKTKWNTQELQILLQSILKSTNNDKPNDKILTTKKFDPLNDLIYDEKNIGLQKIKTLNYLGKVGSRLKKKFQYISNESNVDKVLKGTMGLGQSLAYNIQFEQIYQQILKVQAQIEHCIIFTQKMNTQEIILPVIYGVKPCEQYLPLYNLQDTSKKIQIQKQLSKSILKQLFSHEELLKIDQVQQFQNVCLKQKSIFFNFEGTSVQKASADFNDFALQTISVIDHDYKYKTNNRVTLLLNSQMYFNKEISAFPFIDLSQLQTSKGKVLKQVNGPSLVKLDKFYAEKTCKKLKDYHIEKEAGFKALPTMIKLVQLIYLIQKQHNVVGLLVDLNNLYYQMQSNSSAKNQDKFKFKHFYIGVVLDNDGNYTEGFDLPVYYGTMQNQKAHNVLPMPPQIYQFVYTEALDSYSLAFYLYSFFQGQNLQSLIQKQKNSQKLGKQNKLNNKMSEQSPYDKPCQLHSILQGKILQLQNQLSTNEQETKSFSNEDKKISRIISFYSLIYQCTKYEWFQRPKTYQILQCLHRLAEFQIQQRKASNFEESKQFQLISQKSQQEVSINLIGSNPLKFVQKIYNQKKSTNLLFSKTISSNNSTTCWSLQGLKQFSKLIKEVQKQQKLKNEQIISIYEYFNTKLYNFMQGKNNLYKQKYQSLDQGLNPQTFTQTNFNLLGTQSKIMSFGKTVKSNNIEQSNFDKSLIMGLPSQKKQISNPTKLQVQSKIIQESMLGSKKNIKKNELDQSQIQKMNLFLQQVLINFMLKCPTKQALFLTLNTYRNIFQLEIIKKYLQFCDQKWKIKQFQLQDKLKLINLKDKIWQLPRNSLYYSDISLLMQHKIILNLIQDPSKDKKKPQLNNVNSKNLSLNYIYSILISNNLNKVYALCKSQLLKTLYIYINNTDFQDSVIKIFNTLSKCYQKKFSGISIKDFQQTKKIDQIYKVMMIIYNILSAQTKDTEKKSLSPKKMQSTRKIPIELKKKTQGQESVVSMLQYVNNYYTISGNQCKQTIFEKICEQQISHTLSLLSLVNLTGKQTKIKLGAQTIKNLIKDKRIYQKCKKIGVFENRLSLIYKFFKNYDQEMQITKQIYSETSISLLQLSEETKLLSELFINGQQSQKNSLKAFTILKKNQNQLFYYQLVENRKMQTSQELNLKNFNNINAHFEYFISTLIKMVQVFVREQKSDHSINFDLKLLKSFLQFLCLLLPKWFHQSSYIKLILSLLLKFYTNQNQNIYIRNFALEQCLQPALNITYQLLKNQKRLMLQNGFVQFYIQLVTAQFQKLKLAISKQVQNLQTIPVYHLQTEWRLSVFQQLLTFSQDQDQLEEQASRKLSSLNFINFIVDNLLFNSTVMDLRYYKSNGNVLPFRFCRPFKAEAIALIGIALNKNHSKVQNSIIGKVVPLIKEIQKSIGEFMLKDNMFQTLKQQQKLQIVQTIWMFSHISSCINERIKYEFINTGAYEKIKEIVQRYQLLGKFFPKLKSLVQTGQLVSSSVLAFSSIKPESKMLPSRKNI